MLDEISSHKSCIQIIQNKLKEVISDIHSFNSKVSSELLDLLKSMFQILKGAYSDIHKLIQNNEEALLKLNKHFEHLTKIFNTAEEFENSAQKPGNDGKLQKTHALSYFDMKNLPDFEYEIEFSYSTEKLVEEITEKVKSLDERCKAAKLDVKVYSKLKEQDNLYELGIHPETFNFQTKHGFLDRNTELFYDVNHYHNEDMFKTVEMHREETIPEISTDNPFRKYTSSLDASI